MSNVIKIEKWLTFENADKLSDKALEHAVYMQEKQKKTLTNEDKIDDTKLASNE